MADLQGAPIALRFDCSFDDREIAEAARELLWRGGGQSATSCGYVLGAEDAMASLPGLATIDAARQRELDESFELSFAKVAVGTTPQRAATSSSRTSGAPVREPSDER